MEKRHKKAFSLIEMLVVLAVIGILTSILLLSQKTGQKQLALDRSASKLAQDIRFMQEKATGAEKYEGSVPEGGYGIHLKEGDNFYTLFADDDTPGFASSDTIKEISFENENIKVSSPVTLDIVFLPPDPKVYISTGNSTQSIEIKYGDEAMARTIIVNESGLITIE